MVSKRRYCGIILTLALYILVYASLLATPSYAEEDPATHTSERQKLNLFNTHEIRGSLKALKSWKILIKKAEQQIITFHACNDQNQKNCTATSRSWLQMEAIARTKTPDEQLKWVNQFFLIDGHTVSILILTEKKTIGPHQKNLCYCPEIVKTTAFQSISRSGHSATALLLYALLYLKIKFEIWDTLYWLSQRNLASTFSII